jgi:hypothetical protein
MCFSPGRLALAVGPAWQKHCTLTPHVKAADFAPLFFITILQGCEHDVLQCSVTPPPGETIAGYVIA